MEMLAGAAILLAGILIGRFLPSRRSAAPKPKGIQPVCGCGHGSSFHGEDGRCQATNETAQWDGGNWAGIGTVPCTCQKYVGPEPLPSFYAPEIAD
ncbi:hypothetical protein [Actinopolymorpha alba]|uniref:hypothetical protein n=1 Tax=Actinopolymorpha alba TaxID=533267 RepID=UPI00037B6378|nr:hypothetical protein [Actinopolymorpha alba]